MEQKRKVAKEYDREPEPVDWHGFQMKRKC